MREEFIQKSNEIKELRNEWTLSLVLESIQDKNNFSCFISIKIGEVNEVEGASSQEMASFSNEAFQRDEENET